MAYKSEITHLLRELEELEGKINGLKSRAEGDELVGAVEYLGLAETQCGDVRAFLQHARRLKA